MITATQRQLRENVFNSYPSTIKNKFYSRKQEIYDDDRVFQLLLDMNNAAVGKIVSVQNQGTLPFLNGVVMKYDSKGDVIFEGA